MNNALEVSLRGSDLEFSMKANLCLRGKPFLFCPDCHYEKRTGFMGLIDVNLCIPKCDYALMVWLFNARQWKLWLSLRPANLRIKDIENAVGERQLAIEIKGTEERFAVIRIIKIEETVVKITTKQNQKVAQIQIERGSIRESGEIETIFPLFLLR